MAITLPTVNVTGSLPEGNGSLFAWTDNSGATHTLDVDLVVTATDDRSAKLTEHPVETGANVADHIVYSSGKFKIEIAQTQTPIEEVDGFSQQTLTIKFAKSPVRGLTALAIQAVGNLVSGSSVFGGGADEDSMDLQTLQATSPVDRVADLHDKLLDIFQNAYPVTVTFKGRVYPQFLILGIKLTHNKGEFGLGRFSLDVEEYPTVSTATATLPDPKDLRAKANKSQGKKGATEAKPDTSRLRSVLKSGLDAAGFTTPG